MSSDIEELRRELDIVDVISEYLPLERVGSNYRTNCPFHPDKTPSFYVSPSRQIFKCFGCGVGGDAIKFVALYENTSYLEAALELSKKLGKPLNISSITKNQRTLLALDRASDFYRESLLGNQSAGEYLKRRGIDTRTLRKFCVGFAPPGGKLAEFLEREGLLEDYLRTKNLVKISEKNYKDIFSRRVVIPIRDPSGRVIGFGGRKTDDGDSSPKYINSPESDVFKKRKNLFGLYEARDYIKDEGFAILVEGYFDVLRLFSEGIRNVVAPLGTALTEEQAQLLSRFTKKVYVLFDGDPAGARSAKEASRLLVRAGLDVHVVKLPEGYDPDEFVRENGAKELKKLISSSPELFSSLINGERKDLGERIKEFREFLALVDDEVKRFALASEFCAKNKVPFDTVWEKPKEKRKKDEQKLSFKERVFLKGLLVLKPNLELKDIPLREEVRRLAMCALLGHEHELPEDVLSLEVEKIDKIFWDVLEKMKNPGRRRRKRKEDVLKTEEKQVI
ncbi:MAG: DNA primase [Aquificae bacterium]|nr:DNA primase [Aquificota bacterium]